MPARRDIRQRRENEEPIGYARMRKAQVRLVGERALVVEDVDVDFDQVVARVNSHAPEWIDTDGNGEVDLVTHCGWGQGGVWTAPVRWASQPWTPFGLLVVRGGEGEQPPPIGVVEIKRNKDDRTPYRTLEIDRLLLARPLPPGRYHVTCKPADGSSRPDRRIEIVADERTVIPWP